APPTATIRRRSQRGADALCRLVVSLPFFFFKCSGAPRDLPSSPPRRSPDRGCCAAIRAHRDRAASRGLVLSGRRRPSWRSEEHTSELQSHSDLVCRLLL